MAEKKDKKGAGIAVTRKGLIWMIIGLVVMVIGFVILSGGGSDDPAVFNEDMFNFRRLVVAPVFIIAGIAIEVMAIMGWLPGKKEDK